MFSSLISTLSSLLVKYSHTFDMGKWKQLYIKSYFTHHSITSSLFYVKKCLAERKNPPYNSRLRARWGGGPGHVSTRRNGHGGGRKWRWRWSSSRRVVPLHGVNLIYIYNIPGLSKETRAPWHQSTINTTKENLLKFVEYIFSASKDHAGVWFLRYRDLHRPLASISNLGLNIDLLDQIGLLVNY
jgi:hypothetical protein